MFWNRKKNGMKENEKLDFLVCEIGSVRVK